MRELILDVPKNNRPSYLRIADAMRSAIREGQLKAGEFLPSSRSLSESLGVHRHTIMSAMEELIAEGWLVAKEKQGYLVSETLPSRFYEPKKNRGARRSYPVSDFRIVRTDGAGEYSWPEPGEFKYSFKSGLADLRLFPRDEFR